MKSDIEIAQENEMWPIEKVFKPYGIVPECDFDTYGPYKAKMTDKGLTFMSHKPMGQLVLVTATSPTPAGEGKTTTTIGLVDGLSRQGIRTVGALREPSMGPVFGIKGGACGGGYAQIQPMEDINLHYMGDFHAITAANNLMCALVDNSIQNGNPLEINPNTLCIKRCLDVNDRELRSCVIGLGGHGVPREEHFQITVASEIMAIICLARDLEDLKYRIGSIIVGKRFESGKEIYVQDFGIEGAITAVLKDAIRPNLAQTLAHNPVIIHGGPFANIAHGCNSIRATRLAMQMGEVTVTEAGFGADLGAEKFFDIKCREAQIFPNCVVLVTTIRSLKYQGGADKMELSLPDFKAFNIGFDNLIRHYRNLKKYGVPVVVAVNRFASDTEEELAYIARALKYLEAPYAINTSFADGGQGAEELAKVVYSNLKTTTPKYLYDLSVNFCMKMQLLADYYGAKDVNYSPKAWKKAQALQDSKLPICVAKTQYSFSDNPKELGAPNKFTITVNDISVSNGAGFIVVYLGDILTMPGLPKEPAALNIDVDAEGKIKGLF